MKNKLERIIFYSFLLLTLTGCNQKDKIKDDVKDNNECCEGCICGDTIELLKNIETAWTLTEINDKGEYIYNRHSFINFHGTEKNKFAFFKNDDNSNPISSVKGNFSINEKNEIILEPNDEENKITCKLGEEKNLIAILECDNDFGTFTLQKQGTYELSKSLIDAISKTGKITIKNNQQNSKETKNITDKKEIEEIISIINNSKVWTGAVTTPSPLYEINLYDSKNNIISKIQYNPGHYFNIEINNTSYNLTNIDKEKLNNLLSK